MACVQSVFNKREFEQNNNNWNLQFKLSTDIEKNPGPSVYVDHATKTIHAPYCQENVVVFGENAGQQCVAISLCALIYNRLYSKIRMITSVDDMIQIMTVGNQLYSVCPLETLLALN